jgi:hypothetical protein
LHAAAGIRDRALLGDCATKARGEEHCLFAVGLRHKDAELLAAEPRRDVDAPHALTADVGDLRDHLLAGLILMAVGVVDRLEVIDFAHHRRERPSVALDARPRPASTELQRVSGAAM